VKLARDPRVGEGVFERLRREGYDGGTTILKDYLGQAHPPRQAVNQVSVMSVDSTPGSRAWCCSRECDYKTARRHSKDLPVDSDDLCVQEPHRGAGARRGRYRSLGCSCTWMARLCIQHGRHSQMAGALRGRLHAK